jgi:hypothetical protein
LCGLSLCKFFPLEPALHDLEYVEFFEEGILFKCTPGLHVGLCNKLAKVLAPHAVRLSLLREALHGSRIKCIYCCFLSSVLRSLHCVFLTYYVSSANNHNSKILSLVEECASALEDGYSLEEPNVLNVVLVLLILSVWQELHHVEVDGPHDALILPDHSSHFEDLGFRNNFLSIIFCLNLSLDGLLMIRLNPFKHLKVARYHQVNMCAGIILPIQDLVPLKGMSAQVVRELGQGRAGPGPKEGYLL